MRTVELMIVFGALMAIVAVVAIAIDWVGKPMRGRRFIPRVYRFDDELEPVALSRQVAAPPVMMPMGTPPMPYHVPPMPNQVPSAFSNSIGTAETGSTPSANDTWNPDPTVVAVPAVGMPSAPASSIVQSPQPLDDPAGDNWEDWDELLQSAPDNAISGVDPEATQDWGGAATWETSMALDAVVGGQRPTPIDMAERYWKTVAVSASANLDATHFDSEQIDRMLAGRAPNRLNPRTTRHETPELLGLRSASHPSQVQVFWPGDSIDPWSSQ